MIKEIQAFSLRAVSLGVALVAVFLAAAPAAQAQALATTDVSGLRVELIDLNSADAITPQLGRLADATSGISLSASNWANYQQPTYITHTAAGLFSPGEASISNANATAGISVSGDVFSASGAEIRTHASAYGAPVDGFVLGTRVQAVQDNLSAPVQGLRVTPYTSVILAGQISFFGSITETPYPYTQQADSLVLVTLGRPGAGPVSFSAGVAVEFPTSSGGPAAAYSQSLPLMLTFDNATPDYVDDLVLQFTVQSFAKSNLVSTVPELPTVALFLTALGLPAVRWAHGRALACAPGSGTRQAA